MHEWYVNFAPEGGARDWDDAREFGFVAAGYDRRNVRLFSRLRTGDRVWVYWTEPGTRESGRYVGRGIVVSDPVPANEATFEVNGNVRPFPALAGALRGEYFDSPDNPDDAEWVARVRWEATRSFEDGVPYSEVGFARRPTTVALDADHPDHAAFLKRLDALLPTDEGAPQVGGASSADSLEPGEDEALMAVEVEYGQGHAVDPREVELAAVARITEYFEAEGWDVADDSAKKLGWDLTVTRPGKQWLVEVKGTAGGLPTVLLTANELAAARDRPDWCLAVVTRALTDKPDAPAFYTGAMANELKEALVFRARLAGQEASSRPVRSE